MLAQYCSEFSIKSYHNSYHNCYRYHYSHSYHYISTLFYDLNRVLEKIVADKSILLAKVSLLRELGDNWYKV